jgi:hypothetical protein
MARMACAAQDLEILQTVIRGVLVLMMNDKARRVIASHAPGSFDDFLGAFMMCPAPDVVAAPCESVADTPHSESRSIGTRL